MEATQATDVFTVESDDLRETVSLVVVRGSVSLAETRALEGAVLESVLRGRRAVILDLRRVTRVGAGLLGGILRIRRGLTGVDGKLALVVDGPPIDELVEASVLGALVSVATTPEEALASVADGSARWNG
ncbi:MAG TPA: STAS domain-containing protein [Solirubrobacteraceae bacterium]|jgi:anti-anti-sigma regulatory factor|nr:STAS domain-containing protein [Solirubrobacteraceae bacterium]